MNILQQLLQPKYPTQQEIMKTPVKHKKEVIAVVKKWRKEIWKEKKNDNPREKFNALYELITPITQIYNKPVCITWDPEIETGCHYNALTKTIIVDRSLSIISTLHELAHHLFGPNEKTACRWSVWLFKKVWPKAFAKLRWEGHLLKRI
jgi:hypothetical protein